MIYYEQYADALLGFSFKGCEPIPIYSLSKVYEILERDGCHDPVDFVSYNESFHAGGLQPIMCDDITTMEDAVIIAEENQ